MKQRLIRPMDHASVWMILLFLGWLALPLVGYIEGRVAPVMGNLTLIRSYPAPPPSFRYSWEMEAEKLRACDWVETRWWLGARGKGKVSVIIEYADRPQVRETGALHWEGVLIYLPAPDVEANSHSDVVHRCTLMELFGVRIMRPWLTITPWYTAH